MIYLSGYMGASLIIPVVNIINAPMKQPAARARTMIATMRDVLSLFLIAGCKNQILSGIRKTPIMMHITPRTLLMPFIRSIRL
jgi:hypothetical protein